MDGDRTDSVTGLTREMWKAGWTFIDARRFSHMAAGLITRSTSNGLTNRCASFHEFAWSGRSSDDSQICGTGALRRFTPRCDWREERRRAGHTCCQTPWQRRRCAPTDGAATFSSW